MRYLLPAAAELNDVLAPYLDVDRSPRNGGCWVLANMVVGLDGTAAVGGKVASLSSSRDSELFLRLRGLADVVLVGAETVRRERYGPIRLDDDLVARRHQLGKGPARIAVVSASLDLDTDLPLFKSAEPDRWPIILTCARADAAHLADVAAEVVVVGDGRVDLALAIAELARRSLHVVLCEGGPTLLGGLVAADLLDEYCLTVSPVLGGDPLPVVNTASMTQLKHFELAHVVEDDGTLFLRYISKSGR